MIGTLDLILVDGSGVSTVPPSHTLRLAQGETATIACTLRDSSGAAVNLTGGQVQTTIRRRAGGSVVLSRQHTIVVAASGTTTLEFAVGDTAALDAGTYALDTWLTDADGNRYPVQGLSVLALRAAITASDTPVSVLPSQVPLAIPSCFFDQAVETVGAATATIATYDLPTGAAIVINGIAACSRTDAPGFSLFDSVYGSAENDGGTITIRSVGTNTTFQTPAISGAEIALVDIGGGQVAIQVNGVIGTTLQWRVSGIVSLVTV